MESSLIPPGLAPNAVIEGPILEEPVRVAVLLAVGERVKVIGRGLRSGQIAETGLKGPTGTLRS